MRFAFAESYRQVIGEGSPPIEEYLNHMGKSFIHIMDCLGLPHSLWQPFREISQNNLEMIQLFSGTQPLLQRLSDYNVQLAILTGKDSYRTGKILDYFGITHFFDYVLASDQLNYPKPNPEGMFRILNTLDSAPQEAVMIGDAVSDILCAQQALVIAVGVTWGIKPERIQTLCQPDYLVNDWGQLEHLLIGMLESPSIIGAMDKIVLR